MIGNDIFGSPQIFFIAVIIDSFHIHMDKLPIACLCGRRENMKNKDEK